MTRKALPSHSERETFWVCNCGWFNTGHPWRCTQCKAPMAPLAPTLQARGGDTDG